MSYIKWQENAICFVNKKQRSRQSLWVTGIFSGDVEINQFDDFQLNEIKVGDFIPASELDTEQKYNEVVEVFGLFGFEFGDFAQSIFSDVELYGNLTICHDGIYATELTKKWCKRQLTYNQIIAIGKLKRMMLEREKSAPKTTPDLTPDFNKASSRKYEREITDRQGNIATVDVYDVLKAFNVTCPATQHAVKKLLCSGLRGHKDLQTDLTEAKESIVRAIELN